MNKLVKLHQVSYLYPKSPALALRDVSIEIQDGEFLGLIGPTGAGKTTFCLTLNGIVPQFYGGRFFGHVTVDELDTLDVPVHVLAARVGMVFEDPESQITATSVENEIAFALENLNVPREEILARIPCVLEAVRLDGLEKKHPHELSGGQKQRLSIAAALALQPRLLVLDEPTSQLDPVGVADIFSTVWGLNRELGMTVVMVSHAAEEMAEYADRVAVLSQGQIVRVGSPDDVYADVEFLQSLDLRPPEVARTFYIINQFDAVTAKVPVRLDDGQGAIKALSRSFHSPGDELPGSYSLPRDVDTPPAGEALISVQCLGHTYGDGTAALQGVCFDVHAGEYLLLVGQNGAGKSTLVKHFLRLLEPTSGQVLVDGKDTRQWTISALAQRIGYVAQNPDHQIFNATVEDEVTFALRNLGYAAAEVTERTRHSLDAMGLTSLRRVHPLSLSKGDRARVVVAAVLAMQPEVIILDEPTTGQDYQGARYILDISRKLHQMGKCVIVVTHHLYLMPEYAERVIVMREGNLLLDAPLRRAYHEVDLLQSTHLTPPQAVMLARSLGDDASSPALLSPQEVAAYVRGRLLPEVVLA